LMLVTSNRTVSGPASVSAAGGAAVYVANGNHRECANAKAVNSPHHGHSSSISRGSCPATTIASFARLIYTGESRAI
jgi:hypothetical protein